MNSNILYFKLFIVLIVIQNCDQRSILVLEDDTPINRDYNIAERPKTPLMRSYKNSGISSLSSGQFGRLYLKLALFYDKFLLMRFQSNETELRQFVRSVVHSSYIIFNRNNVRELATIRLVVVLFQQYDLDQQNDSLGHNQELLNNFCDYQGNLNKDSKLTQWDASVLFTGLNIWSKDNKRLDSDLGLSSQDSICTTGSCALIESREIFVVNTLTHELGHILSMTHDGKDCQQSMYIMSTQFTRNNVNEWSKCSVEQLRQKLISLNKSGANCLLNEAKDIKGFEFFKDNLPGTVWPVDKQCQFNLGPKYRAITSGEDICRSLRCRSYNNWFERKRGYPALEGTYCGSKWKNNQELRHYCRSDRCSSELEIKERYKSSFHYN